MSQSSESRRPGRPAGAQSGEAREAILNATRELLAERGLPRVTLRQVAERADVQPALVNYYFGSKRGLLREVVRGVATRVREHIASEGLRPGDPATRLRRLLRVLVGALAEQPYAPRLLFEQVLFADDESLDEFAEAYAGPNLAVVRQLLDEGRRTGALREADISFLAPQVLGMLFFFFLSAPLLSRLFEDADVGPERALRYAESAADLVLYGLVPREGAGS